MSFDLPKTRIENALRGEFPTKRVTIKTSPYLTGAVEHVLNDVFDGLKEEASASGSQKRATVANLMDTLRGRPELARIFFQHIISTRTTRHKFLPEALLTKSAIKKRKLGMEAAKKAREQAKVLKKAEEAKAAECAVPPVDED